MTDLDVGYTDAAVAIGSWQRVYISVWNGPVTLANLKRGRATIERLARRHPEGHATLSVTTPRVGMRVDAEVRTELAAMARDFAHRTRAVAHVLEGEGFWAAAARGALAGMELARRRPAPTRVFSTVDAAVVWLAPMVPAGEGGAAVKPAELAAAVAALRQRMPAE